MKVQEPVIHCCYTDEGASAGDIIRSSFLTFLKWELEKPVPGAAVHVQQP